MEALKSVRLEGKGWQASGWYLERKYPGKYGRKVQEVHGKDGGPVEIVVSRVGGNGNGNGSHEEGGE
jgi:hypothetical protein